MSRYRKCARDNGCLGLGKGVRGYHKCARDAGCVLKELVEIIQEKPKRRKFKTDKLINIIKEIKGFRRERIGDEDDTLEKVILDAINSLRNKIKKIQEPQDEEQEQLLQEIENIEQVIEQEEEKLEQVDEIQEENPPIEILEKLEDTLEKIEDNIELQEDIFDNIPPPPPLLKPLFDKVKAKIKKVKKKIDDEQDDTGLLLDAIKGGFKLKSVKKRVLKTKKGPKRDPNEDFLIKLAEKLKIRRSKISDDPFE